MATNDFLPFGTGVGANALSQSDYNALAARLSGFSGGIARSPQVNKVWRQSAVMAHVLADVIADFGLDALDNGDLATLKANLLAAIRGVQVRGMTSYAANATFVVPAGVTRIHVRLWGGGGGGHGSGRGSGAAGAGFLAGLGALLLVGTLASRRA